MGQLIYFGSFMYFPENKLEYIPAFLQFFIFFLAAILLFRAIKKISAREQEKAKRIEEKMKIYYEENEQK